MQKTFFYKTVFFLYLFSFNYLSLAAQDTNQTKGVIVTSIATADTTKGETYAIIIGVSKYSNKGITSLRYADADAKLFRNFLKTAAGGNTKDENILCFLNENATASNYNVQVPNWLKGKHLKKGDRLYLYFSGHGVATNEDSYYFLTHDSEPNSDKSNYETTGNIKMYFIKTNVIKPEVRKGVKVMLIMDACRSNEIPGIEDGPEKFTSEFIVDRRMGEMMFISTGPNQVSFEGPNIGGGHGLFTYYLIDGLLGAADKIEADGNNNGEVSFVELADYTKRKVRTTADREFKHPQIPVFCCPENEMITISKLDDQTYARWQKIKELGQMSADTNLYVINTPGQGTRGIANWGETDSLQIKIYNQFVEELKNVEFNKDSLAEILFFEMEKNWPDHPVTLDAKYMLAATYLNFCQQKINLFLGGKGLIHIIKMAKEINKDNPTESADDEQISKLKTIVTTEYDKAETMMEKAFALLKNDPEIRDPIIPKYNFLKTMAAYKKNPDKLEVLQLCHELIKSDPASPAGYLLMAWIYQDLENDSCFHYFKKAASIAPKWAYPQHGLGVYYFLKHNYDSAKTYFNRANQMDNLYGSAYRNLGMIYFNESGYNYDKKSGMHVATVNQNKLIEARDKFIQALRLDSCDSDANEYLGKVLQTLSYFPQAEFKFKLAINCHPNFISGYKSLAELYSEKNNEETALITLRECTEKNPANSEALRNLGAYYLNIKKDYDSAEAIYKKAILTEPLIDKNYFLLARMYLREGNKDKAMDIYNKAFLKIGNNKALFNEIGNLYFKAPSDFESAITYYKKALEMDSTLDYVYFNLALIHNAMNSLKDSVIYYYGKAVDYNPNRWQKYINEISNFYWNKKDTNQAIKYSIAGLKFKYQPFFNDFKEEEKIINFLLAEKKFAEAENIRDQYVDPVKNKSTYTLLMKAFNKADGYYDYKLSSLNLTKAAFIKQACYIALPGIMKMILIND